MIIYDQHLFRFHLWIAVARLVGCPAEHTSRDLCTDRAMR